jgi:hypothetical protein
MGTIAVDGFEVLGSNSDKAVGGPLATRNQRIQITLVPLADALANQECVNDARKPGVSLRVEQAPHRSTAMEFRRWRIRAHAQIGQRPKSKE